MAGPRTAPPHPSHPPASRPHPGPDVLRPVLRPPIRDHGLGPAGGRARAAQAARPLHLEPTVTDRDQRAPRTGQHFETCRRNRGGSARWRCGPALVSHRGPTLGYRLTEDGTSLCYLPDHEPALGQDLTSSQTRWISGHALARGASLLIHDGQYTEDEYPAHRGWGHSSLPDALYFARRCEVERLLLFHHDPWHDDRLPRGPRSGGVRTLGRARRRGLGRVGPRADGYFSPWPRQVAGVTMVV